MEWSIRLMECGDLPDLLELQERGAVAGVFAGNGRACRFYEKLGWRATGAESRTSFPPHPTLLEYVLDRVRPPTAG